VQIITLTTDFGTQDWFVGTMKGVILGIAPRAVIVDITHEIPAGDVRAGAFTLAAGYRFFPKGTVHVAVVDPGVGSTRRAIAVQTGNYLFAGPDNGVLSWALTKEKIRSVHRLENANYFLRPVSHTFHGRDIFAPVAAHLSCGLPVRKLGPAQKNFVRLPWPQPRMRGNRIEGEVVFIDRFGNAITNIEHADWDAQSRLEVFLGRRRLCQMKAFYQSVPAGQAVAVPGASGFMEIAVNGGSAAKRFGLKVGDQISVCWR
jgi:S-adenosylmethionine hydrolase